MHRGEWRVRIIAITSARPPKVWVLKSKPDSKIRVVQGSWSSFELEISSGHYHRVTRIGSFGFKIWRLILFILKYQHIYKKYTPNLHESWSSKLFDRSIELYALPDCRSTDSASLSANYAKLFNILSLKFERDQPFVECVREQLSDTKIELNVLSVSD